MVGFELTIPEFSYLFGFLQTDGHLERSSRNRGRVRLELQVKDCGILVAFKRLIPVPSSITTRERDTNFKKKYRSAVWTFHDQGLRTILNDLGLPYGEKSSLVQIPTVPFSEPDYFRGLLDGDGSLGITRNGLPFVSFTAKSANLTQAFLRLLLKLTGKAHTSRPNTRDQIYNIGVFKEDAQTLAGFLYYPGCLCLDRKGRKARQVLSWIRPASMIRVTWSRRKWTSEEDSLVLDLPVSEAAWRMNRTERSVRIRLSRLRHKRSSSV